MSECATACENSSKLSKPSLSMSASSSTCHGPRGRGGLRWPLQRTRARAGAHPLRDARHELDGVVLALLRGEEEVVDPLGQQMAQQLLPGAWREWEGAWMLGSAPAQRCTTRHARTNCTLLLAHLEVRAPNGLVAIEVEHVECQLQLLFVRRVRGEDRKRERKVLRRTGRGR